MAKRQKPQPPSTPPPRELDLDEKQEFQTGLRQLDMHLKRYADFSLWLAQHGRAT